MCRWHCACDFCQLDSGFLFRAQTDSSCSGEIITRVLHHDPANRLHDAHVFAILQEAAVTVDAEPGMNAGMHVHVGADHMNLRAKREAFWAFLRYEPLLQRLAQGRFMQHRSGNNAVRDLCSYALQSYSNSGGSTAEVMAEIEAGDGTDALPCAQETVLNEHLNHDRHSNLNLNTGHRTWEYRLWNSTRSAWRMELFTRLSVALVDPGVVAAMNATELPQRFTRNAADRFAVLLHDAEHERCAELVDRQATYSWEVAASAPSTLTCI